VGSKNVRFVDLSGCGVRNEPEISRYYRKTVAALFIDKESDLQIGQIDNYKDQMMMQSLSYIDNASHLRLPLKIRFDLLFQAFHQFRSAKEFAPLEILRKEIFSSFLTFLKKEH